MVSDESGGELRRQSDPSLGWWLERLQLLHANGSLRASNVVVANLAALVVVPSIVGVIVKNLLVERLLDCAPPLLCAAGTSMARALCLVVLSECVDDVAHDEDHGCNLVE